MTRHAGEAGYASVAAIAGVGVFALMALALVQAGRATTMVSAAHVAQARAAAAAQAGLALGLDGALSRGWPIDGRPVTARFEGFQLVIRIEDERGKVPLNQLDEGTASALARASGVDDEDATRIAAHSLLDWIDGDDEPRVFGAESVHYRRSAMPPRNGPMLSVDELGSVRGWTRAMVERVRPFVTVHFGNGGFDLRNARPEAIGVMQGGGPAGFDQIVRARAAAGQREAMATDPPVDLSGRTLSIRAEARAPDGSRAERRAVVEIGTDLRQPPAIRAYD